MLIIECSNKSITQITQNNIIATRIDYEISEKDLHKIEELNTGDTKTRSFSVLYNNICELVVDNLENKRLLIGGIRDNKAFLTYYIVKEGMEMLLSMLLQAGY